MKPKKPIPYEFVLERLDSLSPYTKPMFGCTAVYVGERIVLILRDRQSPPEDDGIWVATTAEHHASLRKDFPHLRDIALFGPGPTGWQVLPVDAPDFEEAAFRACARVLARDPRIGKTPKARLKKAAKSKKAPPAKKNKQKTSKKAR